MSSPTTSLTPEQLYLQLGSLVREMPDLASGPITPEMNRWLGRAAALIEKTRDTAGQTALTNAAQWLAGANRDLNAQKIAAVVYQALGRAELAAPAALQGTFIAAGHTFDAFAAVSKVLGTATTDLLLIDPYADEKVLTDYAVAAPEQVSVRILADRAYYKMSLKPAAERWVEQFPHRPLSVRLAAERTLHDRAVLVDGATAWTLGQSFNALATRAHTTLVRQDHEPAALMVAAFEKVWRAATLVVALAAAVFVGLTLVAADALAQALPRRGLRARLPKQRRLLRALRRAVGPGHPQDRAVRLPVGMGLQLALLRQDGEPAGA